MGTPWELFWRWQVYMWAVLADDYINPYRNLSGHVVCSR